MEQAEIDVSHPADLTLSQKIVGWTNNLLATSVVIIIALVLGSHLVSSWKPAAAEPSPPLTSPADAWPVLQNCSLEFGDSPYQLQRSTFLGSEVDVLAFLQSRCKAVLESNALPVGEPGEAERKMLDGLHQLAPIEEKAGVWRIFHVRKLREAVGESKDNLDSHPKQLPQVIGIRDDCSSESSTEIASRMVVWGIAIPGENKGWTTFVGKSSNGDTEFGLAGSLIPEHSKRTLVMSNPDSASVIGFVGDDLHESRSHFDDLAHQNEWRSTNDWQQNKNNWTRSYTGGPNSRLRGIQVQLHVNHTETTNAPTTPTVRGMITLTAAPTRKDFNE